MNLPTVFETCEPREDVLKGTIAEADFAADLAKVIRGIASDDYQNLYMANCHLSSDWQFKQSVAVALPAVILKAGGLRGWAARFLPGRVAG